jgi:hypothetical protein
MSRMRRKKGPFYSRKARVFGRKRRRKAEKAENLARFEGKIDGIRGGFIYKNQQKSAKIIEKSKLCIKISKKSAKSVEKTAKSVEKWEKNNIDMPFFGNLFRK